MNNYVDVIASATRCQGGSNPNTLGNMETDGFGPCIRRARESAGISQKELADRVGVSRPYMSQIESGKIGLPGAALRRKIADALHIRHIDLLVAAGELASEEVPSAGAVREPFPEGDVRRQIVAVLADILDEHDQQIVLGLATVVQQGGLPAPEYERTEAGE